MIRRLLRRLTPFVMAAALVGPGIPSSAEVSLRVVDDTCTNALVTISLGIIIEDADPVGRNAWTPLRIDAGATVINPSGDPRGDRMPDLVFDSESCVVRLVWPYKTGTGDYDIAYLRLVRGATRAFEFLTNGLSDDLDPRMVVAADAGEHVVWWTDGPTPAVYLATRADGDAVWGPAVPVSAAGESARYPSVAVTDGTVRVAYERSVNNGKQVVVATLSDDGTVTREILSASGAVVRTDPQIHSSAGRLWVDWKDTPTTMVFSEWNNGRWTTVRAVPRKDDSWIGDDTARRTIRHLFLVP